MFAEMNIETNADAKEYTANLFLRIDAPAGKIGKQESSQPRLMVILLYR